MSLLTWSVVISCLLHSSVLVPSFLDLFGARGEMDVELEWMKSFDSLNGLGHGSDGRWAEIDAASFRTKNEKPEPEPEVEPEPKPEPEPEPEREPEPEPEPERKPEKQKPREREATPPEPTEEREPSKPKKPRTPQEVYSEGELPGLDRAGPNNLPAMEGYGPGNAVFTALVRLDRIRGTEFEEGTRELLRAVPDYRIVLKGTGIDPLRDIDSMFMASPDPVYIQETFLAVRHGLTTGEIRTRLDRRFDRKIPWSRYQGLPTRNLVPPDSPYQDPRKILIARDGLALVAQPTLMSQLTGELPPDSQLAAGVDVDNLQRPPTMLDGLEYIERAAEADETIVLMSAMGARVTIPGVGRVNVEGAKIEIARIDRPELTIDIAFSRPDEARRFARECPELKKRILREVPWIARNITRMVVERLSCESSEHYVAIEGRYTRDEVHRLMNIALPFVPRPPALAELPPAPPEPPVSQEGAKPQTNPDTGLGGRSDHDSGEASNSDDPPERYVPSELPRVRSED